MRLRARKSGRNARQPRDDCSSSSCRTSSQGEDESEGSLADFIEHDSDEGDGEESYEEDEHLQSSARDDESEDEQVTRASKRPRTHALAGDDADDDEKEEDVDETTTEEDPDEAIKRQYRPEMETTCGSVITDTGVRRSMRSNKGRAPVRYVDEDYAELMLEDVGSEDREALAQELTDEASETSDASDASDASGASGATGATDPESES